MSEQKVDTTTKEPLGPNEMRRACPPGFTAWGPCPDCKQEAWLISYVGVSDRSCVPCYWRLHR